MSGEFEIANAGSALAWIFCFAVLAASVAGIYLGVYLAARWVLNRIGGRR